MDFTTVSTSYKAEVPSQEGTYSAGTQNKFLKKVDQLILRHIDDEDFNSVALSRAVGVSRSQLFRKIKSFTGFSTALYIRKIRLEKSAELLKHGQFPIKIVSYAVGFRDVAYFSRCFKQTFGHCPSQYRSETLTHVV